MEEGRAAPLPPSSRPSGVFLTFYLVFSESSNMSVTRVVSFARFTCSFLGEPRPEGFVSPHALKLLE